MAKVAIIGADDDRLICELSNPPLSSIALSSVRAGYDAAELLDALMSGKKPDDPTVYLGPLHVVTRQSTDVQAVADREVATAMNFIRNNIVRPIQVNDVVKQTHLSRNILAKRFKNALGRTMQQEIRSLRIERLAALLLTTNMPISQLASTMVFSDPNHFSRYFLKEKKMTPLAYRRRYAPLEQGS